MEHHLGIVGLANLGNTCYANSLIQALRHTEDLSLFLHNTQDDLITNPVHTGLFVKAYTDLSKCLSTATGPGFVRPMGFWKPMQEAARASGFVQFCERGQEDSHEFLVFILDMLHEGLKKVIPIQVDYPPSLIRSALEAWRDAFTKSYSPLVDMFFGLHLLTTTCQGCNKSTTRFEPFNCLKASLDDDNNSVTILKSIANELKEETIEGFDCPHCSPARHNVILRRTYWKLPKYLAVAIKRFHGVGDKKKNPISSPSEPICFSELFSQESPELSKNNKYEPYAIVDHHGSYFGGHYTAQAYSKAHSKWFMYDDENTQELKNGPIFGNHTYIVLLKCLS